MALRTCAECGADVSTAAKACPQCGAKGQALNGRPKTLGWVAKGALVLFGISFVAVAITNQINPPKPLSAAEKAEKTQSEKRNLNIANYARSLKAAARDPESLSFDEIVANDDGTLVCFKYRAKNGFGGTNREVVAFSLAGGSREPTVVKTVCRDKAMHDVTKTAKYVIDRVG
jgi:ribosomal protein L40E